MSRPKDATWRAIVGHERRPYDTTAEGAVLSVVMDILECGHKVKSVFPRHKKTYSHGERGHLEPDPQVTRRICKTCEKEQS